MKGKILLSFMLATFFVVSGQDFVRKTDGTYLWADSVEDVGDYLVIELEKSKLRSPKSEIALVEYAGYGIVRYNYQEKNERKAEITPGYMKGNRMYVGYRSKVEQERAGGRKMRDYLMADGYWEIVDTPEEADCVLEYEFSDKGHDSAWFVIKDKGGKEIYRSKKVGARDMVAEDAGFESAEKLYKKEIKRLKKKLKKMYESI